MKKISVIVAMFLVLTIGFISVDFVDAKDLNEILKTPKIDLVFVVDSTGSMFDEIREVKMHIKNIIEDIQSGKPKPDVSVGFLAYRDYSDQEQEYLFKKYKLTTDIKEAITNLDAIDAKGGGNYEEAVSVGLDVAINDMNWRLLESSETTYDDYQRPINSTVNSSIKRIIVLIGDAPPRTNYYDNKKEIVQYILDYQKNIDDAKRKDILINTISGTGMDSRGVKIFKEIAEESSGEYEQLKYEQKVVEQYVAEEELDESWLEVAKEERDYNPKFGTIQTNNLRSCVVDQIQSQTESLGIDYSKNDEDYTDDDEDEIFQAILDFFNSLIKSITFW